MSKKNTIKILLDVVMTGILVLLYNSHVFALAFHEIAGLSLAGMFIIHCLFNKKWITSVTSKFFGKGLAPRVRIGYVINFLLLVSFTFIIISGILTSQVLFPSATENKDSVWRGIHHFFAAMSIILVGLHIGLHWGFITGMFKKIIRIPAKITKPLSIGLLVIILAFGCYSIATSSFRWWLVEPFGITEPHGQAPVVQQDDGAMTDAPATTDPNKAGDESKDGAGDYNDYQPKAGENKENTTTQAPDTSTDKAEGDTAGAGDYNDHQPKAGESKSGSTNQTSEGSTGTSGDYGSHPAGEKKSEEGDPAVIAHTAATYLSIFGVFAAIAYYIDKYLLKKRKSGPAQN